MDACAKGDRATIERKLGAIGFHFRMMKALQNYIGDKVF